MPKTVSADSLRDLLNDGGEIALLDVREEGVFLESHLFWAVCIPLSRLELRIDDMVPRRDTRIVLCDDGAAGLAEIAAERLESFGYTDVAILEGGTAGWAAAGHELFSGVNVPSKAFGEFVEHTYDTPRIPAEELKRMMDEDTDMVILDSRPAAEYHRMNIPGGVDCPGAELVYRVHDLAPNPETTVVVNCAGRTRSIIGAQSLINAGIPNKVVALKDGTMGWELAGFDCETGQSRLAGPPTPAGLVKAINAAQAVADRFGVETIDIPTVEGWLQDPTRTTYLLDVRAPEEFLAGHIPGSIGAPGGQLVQATDEYVGVRNARLVLIDDTGVRARMTASWLVQLGWPEVRVLDGGLDSVQLEEAPNRTRVPGMANWPTVDAPTAKALIDNDPGPDPKFGGGVGVLDLADSLTFRDKGHIPGAWWGVRARMTEAVEKMPDIDTLILVSPDSALARLAAPEAAALWDAAQVLVLEGGMRAWTTADLPTETGIDRATTSTDDVWYKPYDHPGEVRDKMQGYLDWEVALVEQMARDGTVSFRRFD